MVAAIVAVDSVGELHTLVFYQFSTHDCPNSIVNHETGMEEDVESNDGDFGIDAESSPQPLPTVGHHRRVHFMAFKFAVVSY